MKTPTADRGLASAESLERGRSYLRLLRQTLLRIDRVSAGLINPQGLTNQQFLALFLIRDQEGLSQVELTAQLDSDQNTVSGLVRRLAARGLISREPHPTDRRAVRLVVTAEGTAFVDKTLPEVDRLSLKLAALMPLKHEKAIVGWLEKVASLSDLN